MTKSGALPAEDKKRDLNKLMSRMDYIMKQAVANVGELYSQSIECTAREMLKRLNEALEKDPDNTKNLKKAIKKTPGIDSLYYNGWQGRTSRPGESIFPKCRGY